MKHMTFKIQIIDDFSPLPGQVRGEFFKSFGISGNASIENIIKNITFSMPNDIVSKFIIQSLTELNDEEAMARLKWNKGEDEDDTI